MKKYYWIINLALVSVFAYLVSDLLLNYANKTLSPTPVAPSLSLAKTTTKQELKPVSYYTIITERNLFNSVPESAIPKDKPVTPPPPLPPVETPKEEDLPLTKLNLKLTGTVAGTPGNSYAFIEDKNKRKQDLYKIGDKVQDAEIIDIARTKVILRNKGKDEVLLLYEDEQKAKKLQQASVPAPAAQTAPATRRSLLGRGMKPAPSEAGSQDQGEQPASQPPTEEGIKTISREEINKNIENLNQFMSQVRLRPYFVEGKSEGFMISQIAPGSLLEKIGLTNGDVLKSVNGIPIDSPEKAFEVYQQLREETTIVLDIERNRTPQTFTYNIQ